MRPIRWRLTICAAPLLLALALPATAQRPQQPRQQDVEQQFTRMDANRDGAIDRAEWRGAEAAFARADANRDGKITREELAAFRGGQGAPGRAGAPSESQLIVLADRDRDGHVSRQELLDFFTRADANRDGRLSAQEVKSMTPQAGPPPAQQGEAPQAGQAAPDFTLRTLDGKSRVQLATASRDKPTVLVFGSYT